MFEQENKAFEERKAELLELCPGKFAIFKGSEFGCTYDTAQAAYSAGIEKYGNVSFLMTQVVEHKSVAQMPALFLGLIHACS